MNMLHLSAERLAALAGEEPTSAEAAHLARCQACAAERAAHGEIVRMALEVAQPGDALALPLTRWDSLAAELRREGLILPQSRDGSPRERKPGATARHRGWRARWMSRSTLRVAAALLLVAGGMMVGRASAGESAFPLLSSSGGGVPTTRPNPTGEAVSSPASTDLASAFASPAEALEAQRAAEATYQQASAFLAQFDTTTVSDSPDAYRVRLAALDRAGRTMREALQDAPFDPVINGYYLATLGQREATLRQLSTSLPGEARITSF